MCLAWRKGVKDTTRQKRPQEVFVVGSVGFGSGRVHEGTIVTTEHNIANEVCSPGEDELDTKSFAELSTGLTIMREIETHETKG
jgi:hypothetical protein